ncbi:MAG TPA: protease modulator HflC [Candidatus Avoscillospira stercorigallinarum]|uniref:Protein HflC n=1 Tax=Candidatus Avoscillospira stercorigallinarum TaxID=2840708 RepID=A0A9D1CPE8_9FIRM|nr:protease modulator HflC [Candidatus Avoscillospira stercorigallinarum]
MGKVIRNIVIVVLVLVVLIGAVSALVVTRENEYTIVRQFGRVVSIRDTAGLSFKIPFLQDVQTLPNTVLLYDLPVSDVITKDKKTMVADSFVLWRISDPQKFIQTLNSSVSNAESRLSTLVYNAMNNTISGMNQSEVISGRDGELASAIKAGVTGLDQYGIELIAVETKRLDLPDDNKEAVYQRMISERNNIAAQYTASGESEAQKIRSETDKEVEIMLSEAKAQAEGLQAEGEAEYMRILSDAYSDPDKAEFYNFVRSLDAAKASLTNEENVLILGPESPLAQIFNSLEKPAPAE